MCNTLQYWCVVYVCSAAVVAFVRVYACNGALRRLLLLRRTMKHGKRAFFRLCQCVFGSRSGQIDAKITRTPNTDERRSQPELKRVRKSIKGCPFRFHRIDSIDSWIVPNRSCFLRPRIDDRKFINREKCTRYNRVHNNINIARMDYTLAQSSKRPLLDCQLP